MKSWIFFTGSIALKFVQLHRHYAVLKILFFIRTREFSITESCWALKGSYSPVHCDLPCLKYCWIIISEHFISSKSGQHYCCSCITSAHVFLSPVITIMVLRLLHWMRMIGIQQLTLISTTWDPQLNLAYLVTPSVPLCQTASLFH